MSQVPESTHQVIQTKIRGSIGQLFFDNPNKFNALPQDGWEAIPGAIDRLVDQGARVIIVSGSGSHFCAGADISEFGTVRKNAETAQVYEKTNIDGFAALRNAAVPTIAQIRGYCLGGGFGLAAACDIRLAEESAVFGVPAAKLGLAYPVDAMADIVNAVGTQNAKTILYTAKRFTAAEMNQFGFLAQILSADELDEAVEQLAEEIAAGAPLTHRASKAAISAALGGNMALAEQMGAQTFSSEDYAEGRAAFREKRKPQFSGK